MSMKLIIDVFDQISTIQSTASYKPIGVIKVHTILPNKVFKYNNIWISLRWIDIHSKTLAIFYIAEKDIPITLTYKDKYINKSTLFMLRHKQSNMQTKQYDEVLITIPTLFCLEDS